jgi:hypothetical protein
MAEDADAIAARARSSPTGPAAIKLSILGAMAERSITPRSSTAPIET